MNRDLILLPHNEWVRRSYQMETRPVKDVKFLIRYSLILKSQKLD